jgi:hypothetical protein
VVEYHAPGRRSGRPEIHGVVTGHRGVRAGCPRAWGLRSCACASRCRDGSCDGTSLGRGGDDGP